MELVELGDKALPHDVPAGGIYQQVSRSGNFCLC